VITDKENEFYKLPTRRNKGLRRKVGEWDRNSFGCRILSLRCLATLMREGDFSASDLLEFSRSAIHKDQFRDMSGLNQFQMFWLDGPLDWMAKLCVRSFIRFPGVDLHLYSYDKNSDPKLSGCVWKDAEEILPYEIVDQYRRKMRMGYAPASDIFRYQLLWQKGGWYFDTDCLLIKPLNPLFDLDYAFAWEELALINNGVIKFPRGHVMLKRMYERCMRFDPKTYMWADSGPTIFTKYLAKFGLLGRTLPSEYFYPIHYTNLEAFRQRFSPAARTFVIHLWHGVLRTWTLGDMHEFLSSLELT